MTLRCLLAPLLTANLVVAATPDPAREPWTAGAFVAPAAELPAAAAALADGDAPVLVLFEAVRLGFDQTGGVRWTFHTVYTIRRAEAVDTWSRGEWSWSPWYQDRPSIAARVVTADGAEHRLDPATIGEYVVGESGPFLYGDARGLGFPLPAVGVGSVVEMLVTVRERDPLPAAGAVRSVYFRDDATSVRARVILEYPSGHEPHWRVRGLEPPEPVREEADGLVRVTLERGRFVPPDEVERFVPEDRSPLTGIRVATGRSWRDVARAYHEVVERRLVGADVRDLVRGAVRGAKTREAKIAAIVARLHRDVRYTGVEFGEASLVPSTPETTLQRRYGDCKDKSALLVALLRAAGEKAHVALVSTRGSPDVEEGLPGLGEFDHVVVRVGGTPPLWIDATADHARIGELPVLSQGRRVLVASPDTTGLETTPTADAAVNTLEWIREIRLADLGAGSVVETLRPRGAFEEVFRDEVSGGGEDDRKRVLADYMRREYRAGTLDRVESTDPEDLSVAFERTVAASGAGVATTLLDDARVELDPSEMFGMLRFEVGVDETTPRRSDLELPHAWSGRARWRVIPPAGFVARPLPEGGTTALGPAVLERTFAARPDGAIDVDFRLDVSRVRWTADEVNAAREAFRASRPDAAVVLGFEHPGETLLGSGKIPEAMAAFRDEARARPDRALPHERLSRGLLAAGLGTAAIREAREAVRVEPASARAHAALGRALQHDALGRPFGEGWDRDAAVAAYRRAVELAPDDGEVGLALAKLLEHDRHGERYGPGADFDAALAEYRRLNERLGAGTTDGLQLFVLARAGRMPEAVALARAMEPSDTRSAWLLAVTAVLHGPERAIEQAPAIAEAPEARRKALQTAGSLLLTIRRYPEASRLLEAGAPAADRGRVHSDALRSVAPVDPEAIDVSTPEGVARRFVFHLATEDPDLQSVLRWFSPAVRAAYSDDTPLQGIRRSLDAALRAVRRGGLPKLAVGDVASAMVEFATDGDAAGGWRVRMRAPTDGSEVRMTAYLTSTSDGPRIAATTRAESLMFPEVVRRIDAGDLEGAGRWLDWARESLVPRGGDDPLRDVSFVRLWSRGAPREPGRMRLAAAALGAWDRRFAASAVDVLAAARPAIGEDEVDATSVDMALVVAFKTLDRWAEVAPVAARVYERYPASDWAFSEYTVALQFVGGADRCREVCERRLRERPNDVDALRALYWTSLHEGKPEEAFARLETLARLPNAEPRDFNNLAWARMARGLSDDETLGWVRRTLQAPGGAVDNALHTLAVISAERGEIPEAVEALRKVVARHVEPEAEPGANWYVVGRIAEAVGERAEAAAAYEKVQKPADDPWLNTSSWALAQRRRAALMKP
ncbi:MAG TPA: DUF3857 domain-containing protein [Candidatus Polarisedimenticolaceae bacterium]